MKENRNGAAGLFLGIVALMLASGCIGGQTGYSVYGQNPPTTAPPQTQQKLMVSTSARLGDFLVDERGYALYMFNNDAVSESNCADECAAIWPPLETDGQTVPGDGVTGSIDYIVRADGGRQVTYNGIPLYHFASDSWAGDVKGQGVKGLWHVVSPSATALTAFSSPTTTMAPPTTMASSTTMAPTASDAPSATVVKTGDTRLGTVLVDANGMTLYTFNNDAIGQSNCYGTCATIWPPLTTQDRIVTGSGVTGVLEKTSRTDGVVQVTYNGRPLYLFSGDKAAGDVNGQGVNGLWYVSNPMATPPTTTEQLKTTPTTIKKIYSYRGGGY